MNEKAYKKPEVQRFGTFRELTQSRWSWPAFDQDDGDSDWDGNSFDRNWNSCRGSCRS